LSVENVITTFELVGFIGSITSIGGGYWAFLEAKKSKNAAKKSERIRDEFVSSRKMIELSYVYQETKRILTVVAKVGPSSTERLVKGVKGEDIASAVQDYMGLILEQNEHFTGPYKNRAKELCDDLQIDVEALSESMSFEDKKKFGKSIFYKIQSFMPIVKKISDEKKDQVLEP
jgi:hypothetical protein